MVRNVVRQEEVKHFDYAGVAAISTDYTGLTYSLMNMSQGNDIGQRQGDQVTLKSVHVRGEWHINTGIGAGTTQTCRTMVLLDKLGTGTTQAQPGDILQTTGNIQAPFAPISLQWMDRYIVLADKVWNLSETGNSGIAFNIYRKIPKRYQKARFTGSGANTLSNNNIVMLNITNAAAAYPVCTSYSRVAYTDA